MFKCTDCNREYKQKPQYCDCGNDEFTEIKDTAPAQLKTAAKQSKAVQKKNFMERYEISPFALTFFIVCILLSVLALIFIKDGKKDMPQEQKSVGIQKPAAPMPDINSIWNSKAPVKKEESPPPVVNEPFKNIFTRQEAPKPEAVPQTKTKAPEKKTLNSQLVSQKTSNKTVSAPKTVSKPAPAVKKQEAKTVKTTTKTTTAKKNDNELYQYKVSLRQALFKMLPVTSVSGSGSCGIQFNIDKNGKLTNRGFSYHSNNTSVNDAVYTMLMRLPQYYPPPSSYNGEKIKMTFSFENGSYSIKFDN